MEGILSKDKIKDAGFSWTYLFAMLVFLWPVSVWKYLKICSMMKARGVARWGGFIRALYLGACWVWIPIASFFYLCLVLIIL